MPLHGDKNVGRLYVAMYDSLRVGRIQPIRDLDRQRQQTFSLQRTPRNFVLDRHPIQKLHGDERPSLLLTNVVDSANIGVIQRRRGLRLALKAGKCLRIVSNIFREEFQSDEPVEPRVLGFIDNSHAPTAELFDDAVMRDDLPDHWRESYAGENKQVNDTWGYYDSRGFCYT